METSRTAGRLRWQNERDTAVLNNPHENTANWSGAITADFIRSGVRRNYLDTGNHRTAREAYTVIYARYWGNGTSVIQCYDGFTFAFSCGNLGRRRTFLLDKRAAFSLRRQGACGENDYAAPRSKKHPYTNYTYARVTFHERLNSETNSGPYLFRCCRRRRRVYPRGLHTGGPGKDGGNGRRLYENITGGRRRLTNVLGGKNDAGGETR